MEHSLIGSIVKVSPPFIIDKVGMKDPVVGELYYLGTNEYLGWELQVTVNNTPYQIKSLSQIELLG
jgi:hypothetical protein